MALLLKNRKGGLRCALVTPFVHPVFFESLPQWGSDPPSGFCGHLITRLNLPSGPRREAKAGGRLRVVDRAARDNRTRNGGL